MGVSLIKIFELQYCSSKNLQSFLESCVYGLKRELEKIVLKTDNPGFQREPDTFYELSNIFVIRPYFFIMQVVHFGTRLDLSRLF